MSQDWFERYVAERIAAEETRLRERECVRLSRKQRWQATLADREAGAELRHMQRELRDQPCGARTRAGHPCRRKGLGKGGRCPNHGGMSTGPRTEAGRQHIAEAMRQRWARWRAERETGGAAHAVDEILETRGTGDHAGRVASSAADRAS